VRPRALKGLALAAALGGPAQAVTSPTQAVTGTDSEPGDQSGPWSLGRAAAEPEAGRLPEAAELATNSMRLLLELWLPTERIWGSWSRRMRQGLGLPVWLVCQKGQDKLCHGRRAMPGPSESTSPSQWATTGPALGSRIELNLNSDVAHHPCERKFAGCLA
jgi:hypothetical protein